MSLNQLQTKAESSLAAVSSIDEIAHIRIITKAGGSRKATPAQVREMVGIDYSLLTEQIVPGEFWYVNGVKRQVYTRTFIGTTPTAWSGVEVPLVGSPVGLTSLVYVAGYVGSQLTPNWPLAGGIMEWTYRFAANLIHLGVPNGSATYLKGLPYALTFKYTY